MIEIRAYRGKDLDRVLDEVAGLRIEVFREFPYLYDGEATYERDYLESYLNSRNAVVVLATADGEVVGASTGLPLAEADEAFREPFAEAGDDPADWFYFGESVLRKELRGRGIGHRFFDERESHAALLGFGKLTFCSVIRPEHHPLMPEGYRTHDVFWKKRGFRRNPDRVASLAWKRVDSDGEVRNELVFWEREVAQM